MKGGYDAGELLPGLRRQVKLLKILRRQEVKRWVLGMDEPRVRYPW